MPISESVGKDAALRAATTFVRAPQAVLEYPSVAPEERGPNEAYLFPATYERGEVCWVPAPSGPDASNVLDNIILDEALVTQRRSVPIVFEAVKDLAVARDSYLASIEIVREKWIAGDKVLTEEIAGSISRARDNLRAQIRKDYRVSGFVAKAYDAYRFRTLSQERIGAIKQERVARLMRAGAYQEIIEKATRQTDDLANRVGAFAKASLPVAKALSVGGTIAVAIEIPYRAYQLDTAKTDEQKLAALENLTAAAVSGSFAAACLLLTVGTGGVAFLACGVAPVVSGLFAGEAAKLIYLQSR